MNQRFQELRNHLKLNQADFGERIGLSKASISALESGLRNITERHIMLLCAEFHVNEHWLRTGEGEMFKQPSTFSLDDEAKKHQLTELEINIMHGYMMLDAETREKLVAMLEDAVLNKHSETAISTEVDPTEVEVEAFRQEIKAEQKGKTLLALDERDRESS